MKTLFYTETFPTLDDGETLTGEKEISLYHISGELQMKQLTHFNEYVEDNSIEIINEWMGYNNLFCTEYKLREL